MKQYTREPVNDNGSLAAWLRRLFFGGGNDNTGTWRKR